VDHDDRARGLGLKIEGNRGALQRVGRGRAPEATRGSVRRVLVVQAAELRAGGRRRDQEHVALLQRVVHRDGVCGGAGPHDGRDTVGVGQVAGGFGGGLGVVERVVVGVLGDVAQHHAEVAAAEPAGLVRLGRRQNDRGFARHVGRERAVHQAADQRWPRGSSRVATGDLSGKLALQRGFLRTASQ
jgi:hypothetical protein